MNVFFHIEFWYLNLGFTSRDILNQFMSTFDNLIYFGMNVFIFETLYN